MQVAPEPSVAEILSRCHFDYTDKAHCEIVYRIPFGMGGRLWVVNQAGDAAYEWIARNEAGSWLHSNDGYGDAATALRDGLNMVVE